MPNHQVSFIVVLLDTTTFQIHIREYLRDYKIIISCCLDVEILHPHTGKNQNI